MNRARWCVSGLLLTLLSGLLGCDVAVVALLASKGGSSSSKSPAAFTPDVTFRLWVAELGGAAGTVQEGLIRTNNGDPDPGTWTQIPVGTTSGEFTMPTPATTGFNAILIQATDAQVYEIDAIEVIDATGTTTETAAAGTTFGSANLVADFSKAQGAPNGVGLATLATPTERSFVFFKRTAAITTFRINLWRQGASRSSGDVEWAQTLARGGDQKAGGAAVNSLGKTYLSFKEGVSLLMVRYDNVGNIVDHLPGPGQVTSLETSVPSSGTASIAVNRATNDVFVATTYDPGNIALYRFFGDNRIPSDSDNSIATSGLDLVEANGLTLNSDGDLIVAGAADFGMLAGGVGHYLRKHDKGTLDNMWGFTTPPAPPNDGTTSPRPTYNYAVAADVDGSGNRIIYPTGDLNTILTLGSEDAYTTKVRDLATASNPTGAVTELWASQIQGSGTRPARGQAIGVDGNHNVYVAGFCTGTGLDSFIVTYDGSAAPTPAAIAFFNLTRTGNDEFLDVAVEPDGTVYATGYETNGTQDEDLVLYKIAANRAIVWKRTVNGSANLKDRGVQVISTPTHVMVVGELGIAAGNIDIHVRKYVK